ncbi:MAG: DMT family transporter [Pyrinomonadaceae bacterium]|nr:DMT family transporter [Blastocatellia bacterium]MCW5958152.1 DMT family transporter [Pyrinomonadaceae bacterium]
MAEKQKFLTEGVRAMFLSTLAFSLANILVKQISHIPPMEVVFFRCLFASIFCFIGLYRAGADWKGSHRGLLLARGLFGTTALYFFFTTLQNIPLASAMTIQYLSPIFTSVIAIVLLGEKVRPFQWVFYAMAFSGVLLIEQFDARISPFYLALGIMSAFCSGVAYNLVRRMREQEHPLTVVLHFQLVGVVAGFISLFFSWTSPNGWDWFWLFMIGVFSQLGQIFLTNALQRERAAGVAIINYSGLIYAIAFGTLFFGEKIVPLTIVGMALVVGGVLLSVLYGKRKERMLAELDVTQA